MKAIVLSPDTNEKALLYAMACNKDTQEKGETLIYDLEIADKVVVYTNYGMSYAMESFIKHAKSIEKPIELRTLPYTWETALIHN